MNGRGAPAAGRDTTMHAKTQKLHILDGARRAKPAPVDLDVAIDMIDDLFGWAFGLAKKSVGSLDDRERIRNARRYLSKSLRGKPARCPTEDVLFTAGVLARVCESELRMPAGTIVRLLDELELPTEVVPRVVKQPTAIWPRAVTRCPAAAPRTEDEEETHWFSLWFGADDDQSNGGDDGAPCATCDHALRAAA